MRGITKERFASISYFGIILFGGVGLAYFLCFHLGWGLKGLLVGNSLAYFTYTIANILVALIVDWKKLAEALKLRFNEYDGYVDSIEKSNILNSECKENNLNNLSKFT
jgi:hypothetical protein